jgi:hypothetical protein
MYYAINARFDGAAIIPQEEIPVTGPYEAIVIFTEPAENEEPAKQAKQSLDDRAEF